MPDRVLEQLKDWIEGDRQSIPLASILAQKAGEGALTVVPYRFLVNLIKSSTGKDLGGVALRSPTEANPLDRNRKFLSLMVRTNTARFVEIQDPQGNITREEVRQHPFGQEKIPEWSRDYPLVYLIIQTQNPLFGIRVRVPLTESAEDEEKLPKNITARPAPTDPHITLSGISFIKLDTSQA